MIISNECQSANTRCSCHISSSGPLQLCRHIIHLLPTHLGSALQNSYSISSASPGAADTRRRVTVLLASWSLHMAWGSVISIHQKHPMWSRAHAAPGLGWRKPGVCMK